MGMGTYACRADVIDIDFVREICPKELDEFLYTLSKCDVSFDDFCVANTIGDEIDNADKVETELIEAVYDALKCEFDSKTGLQLETVYHFAEDRGDELNGGSFAVEGVYQLTPAGEKYKDKIVEKSWTIWG